MPERERDAAAAWLIRTLVEQNANLQVAIGRHALLCGQAADALEEEFGPGNTDLMVKDPWALIADLRKAAKWNELHEPRI